MSKKSQKSGSQQQQRQQTSSSNTAQPRDQPEVGRQKRPTSAQAKGSAAAIRDSCDLSSECGSDARQVRASENKGEPAASQQQSAARLERNKRAKLQPAEAENRRSRERMGESESAAESAAGAGQEEEEANICAACAKPIRERYLLMALDKRWHEDCLKCACCDCRLGEVGSTLFTHSDKLLCRRDFLRIFGKKGLCAACHRQIPAYELVMRAQEKAYHMDCFACQRCQYRFCVGDQFHMTQAHKIICLLCHREQFERCQQQQQQQQQQQARELELAAGAFEQPLEVAFESEKRERPDVKEQQGAEERAPFELNQLESVARTPTEPAESRLVACPVQQRHLVKPAGEEQERACVM